MAQSKNFFLRPSVGAGQEVDFLDEPPAAGMQFIPEERHDIEQRLPLLPTQLASQIDEHLGQRIQFA